jgi:hypothetical protein
MTVRTKVSRSRSTPPRQAGSARTVAPTRHGPHHQREDGAEPDVVLSCAQAAAPGQWIGGEE